MLTTIRYCVTEIRWGEDAYGSSGGPSRFLGRLDVDLPRVRVGDTVEIDYDDSEDERGALVASRTIP